MNNAQNQLKTQDSPTLSITQNTLHHLDGLSSQEEFEDPKLSQSRVFQPLLDINANTSESEVTQQSSQSSGYGTVNLSFRIKTLSPHETYDLLMDNEKHTTMFDESAIIGKEAGTTFSLADGEVTGINRELIKGRKIIQDWKHRDWPEGILSQVTITLRKVQEGTKVTVTHSNIPHGKVEQTQHRWLGCFHKLGVTEEKEQKRAKKQAGQTFPKRRKPDVMPINLNHLNINDVKAHHAQQQQLLQQHLQQQQLLASQGMLNSSQGECTHPMNSFLLNNIKFMHPFSNINNNITMNNFSLNTNTVQHNAQPHQPTTLPRPIVHVEIPCKNMDRVKKFYGDVFGWAFAEWTEFYSVFNTEHGGEYVDVRMSDRVALTGGFWLHTEGEIPRDRFITLYIDVDEITVYLEKIKEHGGEIVQAKTFFSDAVGYYAFFRDSEGNQLGLRSML